MTKINILNDENFASQVFGQLKQDILEGYFEPGEKLRMSRLKERYNVGVSPLREALSQLIVEKLVTVENQRGFSVNPITPEELYDIYHTRSHIEGLCIALSIENGDDEWEASVIAAHHRLKKSANLLKADIKSMQEWEKLHQFFHATIASGCGLPSLMQVRSSLYEKACRYRNLWLKQDMLNAKKFHALQKQHDQILELILNRKKLEAQELMNTHILAPYEALRNTVF